MTNKIKTQRPEDFALEILDELTEDPEALTTTQMIELAKAYAMVGQAINSKAKTVTVTNNYAAPKTEQESNDYGNEPLAYVNKDKNLAPGHYQSLWTPKGRYFVDPTKSYADILFYIENSPLIKAAKLIPVVPVEEYIGDNGEFHPTAPKGTTKALVVKEQESKTVVTFKGQKEEPYELNPTRELPVSLREKIEAEIAARV